MALSDWIGMAVLALLWGAQILLRSFEFSFTRTSAQESRFFTPAPNEERLKNSSEDATPRLVRGFTVVFWMLVALMFGSAAYAAELQYLAWAQGGVGAFLLPPHQGIGYFWFYVGERFFAPWLIALLAAILVSAAAEGINKKYHERFFGAEEYALTKIGFFLTGYPGFFFYLILVLFAELLFSSFSTLFRGERAPLYFLWLPLAILAMIIVHYAVPAIIVSSFNL